MYVYVYVYLYVYVRVPIPVAARSTAWVGDRSLAKILGSNPAGGMDACLLGVSCLSGRGLYVELITRPEEFYKVWCV